MSEEYTDQEIEEARARAAATGAKTDRAILAWALRRERERVKELGLLRSTQEACQCSDDDVCDLLKQVQRLSAACAAAESAESAARSAAESAAWSARSAAESAARSAAAESAAWSAWSAWSAAESAAQK